jgi:hypothetical protein
MLIVADAEGVAFITGGATVFAALHADRLLGSVAAAGYWAGDV